MTVGSIDHLTLDAVVAYADGEMPLVSYQRAAAHLALCPQCDAEVRAQMTARSWLRAAQAPPMPSSLLDSLRSIPVALPAGPAEAHPVPDRVRGDRSALSAHPAASGTVGAAGSTRAGHPRAVQRGRRFRFLGAGALVAGLTVGALVGSEPAGEVDPHSGGPQVAHVSPANAPKVASATWGTP